MMPKSKLSGLHVIVCIYLRLHRLTCTIFEGVCETDTGEGWEVAGGGGGGGGGGGVGGVGGESW